VDRLSRKADTSLKEEVAMAAAARKIEMEPQMNERTVLDEKVDHIQKDVTDLKTDVRAVIAGLAEHRLETEKSFGKLREEMRESFAAVRTEMASAIGAVRNDMTAAIGGLRLEMRDSFAKLRSSQSAQIAWMVSTVIAAIGAACAVAKLLVTP
jgi:hypothetical protein